MLCEKHGPWASVTTKTEAEGLCLSHGMRDHDQILQYAPTDPIYARSIKKLYPQTFRKAFKCK